MDHWSFPVLLLSTYSSVFLQLKASLEEQLSVKQLRAEFRRYMEARIAQELIDFYVDSLDREEITCFFDRQVPSSTSAAAYRKLPCRIFFWEFTNNPCVLVMTSRYGSRPLRTPSVRNRTHGQIISIPRRQSEIFLQRRPKEDVLVWALIPV